MPMPMHNFTCEHSVTTKLFMAFKNAFDKLDSIISW